MKRQKRKSPSRKAAAASPPNTPKNKSMSRREMLGLAKFFGGFAVVIGAGGYYFGSKVLAELREGDLSKIGNGRPTIVQVHDPACPSCMALQRETREALAECDDNTLQYLVANLNSPDGRRFANMHGAGRVTLLLFDGAGRMRQRITGEQTRTRLAHIFAAHKETDTA